MTTAALKKTREFDPTIFLATIGEGRKNLTVSKKQGIFTQGDAADAVFYIQKGKVQLRRTMTEAWPRPSSASRTTLTIHAANPEGGCSGWEQLSYSCRCFCGFGEG
jgi:hypothetical protein